MTTTVLTKAALALCLVAGGGVTNDAQADPATEIAGPSRSAGPILGWIDYQNDAQ